MEKSENSIEANDPKAIFTCQIFPNPRKPFHIFPYLPNDLLNAFQLSLGLSLARLSSSACLFLTFDFKPKNDFSLNPRSIERSFRGADNRAPKSAFSLVRSH